MALIICAECSKEISTEAPACPGCGAPNKKSSTARGQFAQTLKPTANYEIFLLGIPVVATLLIFGWVANMNLLQSPGDSLILISIATVAGTALIAAMEAKALGMTSDNAKGTTGPTAWFFVIILIWIFGYPGYLYRRKQFGVANRMGLGILVGAIFLGSALAMNFRIEDKKAEIRESLGQFQQQFMPSNQSVESRAPAGIFVPPKMESFYARLTSNSITRYEIVKRNGSAMDACVQAGLVVASLLQEKDEKNYKIWKNTEIADCRAAGISD